MRAWRQGEGQAALVNAFVPLAFGLGEAFQFDWSEEGLVVGGIYYRLQVSHMKLCASRAFWLVAYPSQGHEMLFDAHTRSFMALGGIPRRGILDYVARHINGTRYFCPACGTHVACINAEHSELVDVAVGSIDDAEPFVPTLQIFVDTRLSWLATGDDG